MKQIFKHILIATSIVVAAACSSDPNELTDVHTPPVRLKGNINTLTQVSKTNENGFENNDKVGVFIAADNDTKNSSNYFDNLSFSYNSQNNALTPSDGNIVCWPTTESRFKVFAYYPYNENLTSTLEYPFAVATDQSSRSNFFASDFLWASAKNIEPQTDAINLEFNHKLSKLNITLLAGNGFETAQLTSAQKIFTIEGTTTEGAIDLTTGIATASNVTNNITPLYDNKLGFSAIIYPQTVNVIFKVIIDGETYAYSTNATFAAGYQYNYVLTINKHGDLTQSMNGVTEWKDGENNSGEMSNIITCLSPQFKAYLLQEKLYLYDYDLGTFMTDNTMIDANNDGDISITEAEKVEYIHFVGDINNKEELKGIEFFNKLKQLSVRYITNTTIDVSKFPNLVKFECRDNQLTSLDVSKNTNLEVLTCIYNNLTTLDVSKNSKLRYLWCNSNQLKSLDVSNNKELIYLSCNSNKLTSLNLNTKLVKLYCYENYLKTLDVSKNTELESLGCNDNRLTTLDVSKNTKLSYLRCLPMCDITGRNLLTTIYMSNNQTITYFYKPEATVVEYK